MSAFENMIPTPVPFACVQNLPITNSTIIGQVQITTSLSAVNLLTQLTLGTPSNNVTIDWGDNSTTLVTDPSVFQIYGNNLLPPHQYTVNIMMTPSISKYYTNQGNYNVRIDVTLTPTVSYTTITTSIASEVTVQCADFSNNDLPSIDVTGSLNTISALTNLVEFTLC